MSVSMESVRKLLEDLKKFDDMDSARQGAFRARVTRYLNKVEDEQVRKILEAIQERVGSSQPRSAKKLTADDLVIEFEKSFAGYDSRRRGAFKAKLSRLLNQAADEGDAETVSKLEAIRERIEAAETAGVKEDVLNIADELGLNID